MSKVEQISGSGIPLLLDDIDTDRIIPARYLRCVTFDGIGAHAFEDDRKQDPNHPFNDARYRSGNVLVSGRNFGCGSSREHAPQSLMRWGVKAVLAESFAEIFFGNCTSLGIPCLCASRADLARLCDAIQQNSQVTLTVDLVAKKVTCGSTTITVEMPDSARTALVSGNWDFLGQLLANQPAIATTAAKIPYLSGFASKS